MSSWVNYIILTSDPRLRCSPVSVRGSMTVNRGISATTTSTNNTVRGSVTGGLSCHTHNYFIPNSAPTPLFEAIVQIRLIISCCKVIQLPVSDHFSGNLLLTVTQSNFHLGHVPNNAVCQCNYEKKTK